MNVRLVTTDNPVFADVVALLQASLDSLGVPHSASTWDTDPAALNIVLAPHLLPAIPRGRYVVYQLEALPHNITPLAWEILRNATAIWDFDPANVAYLTFRGFPRTYLLPLGWHERLSLPEPAPDSHALARDVDVLFYGWINDRRRSVLNEIAEHCRLVTPENCWGAQRDAWIARSKIVLNVHFLDGGSPLEQARVHHLLQRGAFVLSEQSAFDPYGLTMAPYGELARACRACLGDDATRETAARATAAAFRQRPMAPALGHLLETLP